MPDTPTSGDVKALPAEGPNSPSSNPLQSAQPASGSEIPPAAHVPDKSASNPPPPPAQAATVQQLSDVEGRMTAFEGATLRLSRWGLCIAALTFAIIAFQGWEMYSGSKDTRALAEAAKAQSEATKAIAESAKTQAENTAQLATFTSQEVQQLAANVKEAHSSTEHAESALQRSERPWVNAESMEATNFDPPSDYRSSLAIGVRIVLKNTGRSIAKDGWVKAYPEPNSVQVLNKEWRKPCQDIKDFVAAVEKGKQTGFGGTWPMGFVLTPGEAAIEEISFGNTQITKSNFNDGYWVLGCAIYNDQYGKEHHTNFCFQPAGSSDKPSIPKFKICNAMQEAN